MNLPPRIYAPLVALVAASALSSGCSRHPAATQPGAPEPAAVAVSVAAADTRSRPVFEEIVGTVRARQRATVEAKVSGRIDALHASPGQLVKKGERLGQLGVPEIQARLDQARATLEQADRELQRFTALLQQKTVTQQEFDAVEARQRVAHAATAEAETLLGYASITAPFDGIITRKWAEIGDLAGPGRPIVEVEDPTALRVETDVPESLIERIAMGAKLSIITDSVPRAIEAVVGEVSPVADPSSHTFRVKLDLPQNTGLRLGQFARVAVPVGENHALRVPRDAVVLRGQMEIVFVLDGNRARLRLIKTGKQLGEELEVVAGLAPGEKVVSKGASGLVDGHPVTVR